MSILIIKKYYSNSIWKKKKWNPALLGDKNVIKDKNGNSPLDNNIGKITIKMHSLHVQLKMRQSNRVHKV